MRASRKNGDISDAGATGKRAELNCSLSPFYIIRLFRSLLSKVHMDPEAVMQ